jgi:uncharacterized membrane protein (DUF4010 family)
MFETARPFLLALAIGLLIGIERERAKSDSPTEDPLGSRTFTLLALLGAVAAHVASAAIAVVLAAFAGAVILAGYVRTRLGPGGSGVGVTTEVAAMATFALGYMTRSDPLLAGMLAVITLAMLALKPRIHQFAKAGIKQKEVGAALTFLVIAFVVLPLLPNRAVDPWNLVNPARLWLVLVLIAGVTFGGYIAMRLLGPRWGLPLAGFSAGLVSSTAATLSLSQKCRESVGLTWSATVGIVLANTASAAAQLMVVAAVYPGLVPVALPVIGLPILLGLAGSSIALFFRDRETSDEEVAVGNPLALRSTLAFASLLALVLVLVSIASRLFGSAGVLVSSAVGGTTDVHAVTLAVSNLAAAGDITSRAAVFAILIAFLTNMVVKMGLAVWAGGLRLAPRVWPPLLLMMLAAIAGYLIS